MCQLTSFNCGSQRFILQKYYMNCMQIILFSSVFISHQYEYQIITMIFMVDIYILFFYS